MEEKFLEEFEILLNEKIKLFEKNKKDSIKYFLYSQIPVYSTFLINGITDLNIILAFLVGSPLYLYFMKNSVEKVKAYQKLIPNINNKVFVEETTCYKELLKEYKELILRLSDMFDKNKINSLVDIQSSFVFMQRQGYLSESHKWQFKELNNRLYLESIGVSIIDGCGCCRDLSFMLNELLENMDFCTLPLIMEVNWIKNREWLYSIIDTEDLRKILNIVKYDLHKIPTTMDDFIYFESRENESEVLKKRKRKSFNHVIVSTEYKGKVYHFDPTNHLYFKNYDKKHITFYEQDKSLRISFREYRKEKKKLLSLPNPNKAELYNLYNEYYVKNLLERERIFQEFYEANKEIYKRINEKVKMINKYW